MPATPTSAELHPGQGDDAAIRRGVPVTRDHLASLNDDQRRAATAPAPQLLLAGAGTGKTETLARRVADLILNGGEQPDRLLCITFTAKAAGEMRLRLASVLAPDQMPRWVGTFHAAMARLLMEDGAGLPCLARGFSILSPGDARSLLMQVAGVTDIKDGSQLQEAVSLLRNALATTEGKRPRSAALLGCDPEILERATALVPAYRAALADREVVDFDDLIVLPVLGMRADPALADRWSGRWSEILVDEYQDTNLAQHALVRLLAGDRRRVFAVGDDLQAIYGWRGADVAHIRNFASDYRMPGDPLRLEINYRSSPTILRAANAVGANDREAMRKTLRPADPARPAGVSIAIREVATAEQEGRGAVGWVQALRKAQADLAWRDCAILVRAGFVSEPIVKALQEAGIPVRLVSERQPDAPKEVLAVIAWLRLAMSRSIGEGETQEQWQAVADDAFRRCCAFPARGIGGSLFRRLRDHATDRGIALAASVGSVEASDAERDRLLAVLAIARRIGDAIAGKRLGVPASLRLAAEYSGIQDRLRDDGQGRLTQAWTACLQAAAGAGSVRSYCDSAGLDDVPGETEVPDAVQVMTLHRAKGLEFDHVLLAGLEEGVWPNWQAEKRDAVPEERRLFYVGITRARHSLRLSWVRQRRSWDAKPSRFLDEIPRSLLESAAPAFASSKRADHGAPARMAAPPTQAETDRLVAAFMARRTAASAGPQ
ncbi:UvrD-helicase domain-containing protein [Lichenicola cladoniae]|uniref:DNA 3'-5' helicase n=1 Tax=Lichenicola cladoniae TaxID=1484109 RepID=A0A6M8HPB3_9PROT|nr:UvrD-helicase domain-containing protein [Lichenicola cladoniae]NPD68305.1 UvrD-helicase domain-containing protein [Acetobacteraceae bacterium]QKE90188.1 UvrD-helicase domain-containing protein [Lichenicola cladoniae]